jgi:pyrroline-5-carboxylate reductase
MIRDLRIAVIGAGVMGEAMIGGLLKQQLVAPEQIVATEPREERRVEIERQYGVRVTDDNVEAAHWAQVAIFSVKPQTLPKVLPELRGALKEGELVLSIVAGAPIRHFVDALGHPAIVRSMPNTPAQIGEGMTVWTASDAVSASEREAVRSLLGVLGQELYVDDEKYVDMATAVSSSGPAYVFLVIEAFIDAAVHIGFRRDAAERLVIQTVLGSARYAQATGRHPAELRNQVTSPGGTTAEGLLALEEAGLRAAFTQAVEAAYDKAKRLGG